MTETVLNVRAGARQKKTAQWYIPGVGSFK
jgi:hypothetical protein